MRMREIIDCVAGPTMLAEAAQSSEDDFLSWFDGSKVVDQHGRPLKMFHGTHADFDHFHPGSHFGTVKAANQRVRYLERTPPRFLYHVVDPSYRVGSPLLSLYMQHGSAAYDIFARRWPEGRELGEYHAHYVMMYPAASEAVEHAVQFGGRVTKIDSSELPELSYDDLEKPGYWYVRDEVPLRAIVTVTPTISIGASKRVQQLALNYLENKQ